MIYTFIADITNLKNKKTDCDTLISNLPEGVRAHVLGAGNEDMRLCRAGAYATLFAALRLFFGGTDFDVSRDGYGKPYLVDKGGADAEIWISLSHDGDLCAVSLSDEGAVGVDVQSEIDKERAQRLKGRYFDGISLPKKILDTEYMLYEASCDGRMGIGELPEMLCVTEKYFPMDFTAAWTLAEAALKCDGRGFGAVGEVKGILEKCSADIVKIKVGKKMYRIATVSEK